MGMRALSSLYRDLSAFLFAAVYSRLNCDHVQQFAGAFTA